ncbi:ubiquitin carboxyl-terminal hydrolase 43 [Tribolium madens]|uniref:ubiquitin carboxyl-terminal hydrolase 43 n=1 Tax=Tribolium madens TaxID=41895 RepID=UPI001CF7256E|nr:ubiquitin carboxyl-terminal hydrolase 43 [Tribolium madens]
MCETPPLVIKSTSAGDLLNNTMTLLPDSPIQQSVELSKLKRTFTLPRNPFNTAKRRPKESDPDDKRVFRRPSIRKFINKIAQHIGGVPVINGDSRVPPVGLQTWGPDDTPGVTGLKNHGNTCFINAVLQCISHTDVLAEYFVLDRYKIDLSRRNKLNSKKFGTKGEITEQLALLLKALWACQYSPELSTSFKQVVERHGSQYKGNQQHDALEFLQWLLDKVHEDLNTASKKKYKLIKTSGRSDEVIAAETLENYKRCNNSFIQGVFQAQYRSSLSCSRCRTQSNTFDPFQCISVQLPQFSKQSIYVTVLYTSQQPRQVQIGLSLPSGATVSELRDILESDTSIERANMLITEIGEAGFLRTFTDTQSVNIISEIDPIYCIEVAQLKDLEEDTTSAYILLCWINVVQEGDGFKRFGSPYTMQVSRETSYEDLQKLLLKEMAPILHDDILTSSQPKGVFKIRISDPACNDNEPPCYLEPELEHPLFMEDVDQALALCSEEGGPPHVKLVIEFSQSAKNAIIADDSDVIEEHSSVKQLKTQALQGGAPLTLEECLTDYTEAETLTDAWRCPHCQQYQPVVKTLDLWSLPDILVVHFKRFRQQTLRGCSSAKLTTMVDFPVYNLDMSPHLANKGQNIADDQMIMTNGWSPFKRTRKQSNANDNMYDLYGICYHHGSDIETGHYTAACKNPYDSQWYLYDDAKVTNLSKQTDDISALLVNNSAYILFYQRRNVGSSTSSAASTSSVGSSTDHWVSRMPKFVPPKNIKIEKKPKVDDETKTSDEVALRNSQNKLDSAANPRKSLDKSTSTEEVKLYTTSIYINSCGDMDKEVSEGEVKVTMTEPEVRKVYTTTAAVHRYSDNVSRTKLNWMSPQPVRKLNQSQQSV